MTGMVRRRRHVAVAAAGVAWIAASACASAASRAAPTTEGTVSREDVSVDAGGMGLIDVTLWRDESLSADTVAPAPAAAWPALMRAYAALGVPLQGADAKRRVIATRFFHAHSRFAGESLSRWLDCGSSITGDIASSYEITMRIGTRVDSLSGGGARLSSAVSAVATAVGSSSPPVHCTSRRTLEKRLAEMTARGD